MTKENFELNPLKKIEIRAEAVMFIVVCSITVSILRQLNVM